MAIYPIGYIGPLVTSILEEVMRRSGISRFVLLTLTALRSPAHPSGQAAPSGSGFVRQIPQ